MTNEIMHMFVFLIIDILILAVLLSPSNLFKFHPLSLSLLLVFYVLILVIKMGSLSSFFWYPYILFLVMVGGLMILLMYFTSLSNNQLLIFALEFYFYMFMKFIFFF